MSRLLTAFPDLAAALGFAIAAYLLLQHVHAQTSLVSSRDREVRLGTSSVPIATTTPGVDAGSGLLGNSSHVREVSAACGPQVSDGSADVEVV